MNSHNTAGRILVADDEEIFRRSTVDILRGRGYEAHGVCNASEGVNALQENSYDLVIADIKMDGNADLEFVKSMSKKAATPFMIVTGYPSIKSAIDSIQLAIVDYLIKPINPNEFLARVESALQKKPLSTRRNSPDQSQPAEVAFAEGDSAMTLKHVLENQIQEMYRTMEGLYRATRIVHESSIAEKDLCHFTKCPNLDRYRSMLCETVAILVKTKNSFKSKELAELRERIETLLNQQR